MCKQTILGRVGAVLALTLGYSILHLFVVTFVALILSPYFETPPERTPAAIIVSEGQPLKQLNWQINQAFTFQTLDSQPVTLRENQDVLQGGYLNSPEDSLYGAIGIRPAVWSTVVFSVGPDASQAWYYIQEGDGDNFNAYFVAYSNRTRAPLRYVGTEGETSEVPPLNQRFQLVRGSDGFYADGALPISYRSTDTILNTGSTIGTNIKDFAVLITKRGVEHIHFNPCQVEVKIPITDLVSSVPHHDYIFSGGNLTQKTAQIPHGQAGVDIDAGGNISREIVTAQPTLLLRSSDTVYQVDHGRKIAEYVIPNELRNQTFMTYPVDANSVFYVTPRETSGAVMRIVAFENVFKCDAAGQILETLKAHQPAEDLFSSNTAGSLSLAALFPIPLQLFVTSGLVTGAPVFDRAQMLQQLAPSFLLLIGISILSAVAASRFARKYQGVTVEWGWLVYVALVGLPGLIGYLTHFRNRTSPVVEAVDKLGTEIFG